jgi:hypothetical protein
MAKAKRARRNSIRTMEADSSALEALEALERAERPAERPADQPEAPAHLTTATAEDEAE